MKNDTLLHTFGPNENGKDFVCGDVHGQFAKLEDQLSKVNFDKTKDRLFVCGDLVDRGYDSVSCLDYLAQPWFFSILGNHELLLLWSDRSHHWGMCWDQNGNEWWAQVDIDDRQKYRDALNDLPLAMEVELNSGKKIALIHAQVMQDDWEFYREELSGLTKENIPAGGASFGYTAHFMQQIVWDRDKIRGFCYDLMDDGLATEQLLERYPPIKNIDHIFHGHTIVKEIITIGNCSYIDTGSYLSEEKHNGRITVLDIEEYLKTVEPTTNVPPNKK